MRATGLNATVQAYQTLAANKNAQQQYQFLSKVSFFDLSVQIIPVVFKVQIFGKKGE